MVGALGAISSLAALPASRPLAPPFAGVSSNGWLEGLHAGYNWQGFGLAALVAGIETDVAAASVYGQGSDAIGDFYHSRLEALGTVRGRIGYTWDRTLLYFTGGLAWAPCLTKQTYPVLLPVPTITQILP